MIERGCAWPSRRGSTDGVELRMGHSRAVIMAARDDRGIPD
jgi:hypothetical protein